MPAVPPSGLGLLRDLADFRDLTLTAPEVRTALAKLRRRRGPRSAKPAQVDLREYCPPPPQLDGLHATSAAAVLGLTQYFRRRTIGEAGDDSTLFLYRNALRLAGPVGDHGTSLRTTLKALARFGCPPERHFPWDPTRLNQEPDAFCYGFHREFADLRYVRLDPPALDGAETLKTIKACLASGFACVGGATLGAGLDAGGDIAYPTRHDSVAGASAFVVVGYDDAYRIRSTKGALIVRGSFGPEWGEAGFGRLPYRYVEDRLAYDFWTLLKPDWLAAGELEQIN